MMLALYFFVVAILYAAIGFGGGSTYNALLVLSGTDYRILPLIALFCNFIVVSGGTYRFARAGLVDIGRIMPWVVTSVPAAFLGGYLHISETLFMGLLGFSLLAAGIRMLGLRNDKIELSKSMINRWGFLPPVLGTVLGLLAGLLGIGGGIFLAPVLHLLRWDNARKIAAACSVFILVNSLAGLVGQIVKLGYKDSLDNLASYGGLFIAVLIGGQVGSIMGASRLSPYILQRLTAALILYVSCRLLFSWWRLM